MRDRYEHLTISTAPRSWRAVIKALPSAVREIGDAGGDFYGLWISQIGLPMNVGVVMVRWPGESTSVSEAALRSASSDILDVRARLLESTVRPLDSVPPSEDGVYMHRWFETRPKDFDEFLTLSADAWPDYEQSYGARIVGFWRTAEPAANGDTRALLVTRYPNMTAWEQSRPGRANTKKGTAVWDSLLRRHELTNNMVSATMELIPLS